MQTDESSLTGESVPVNKVTEAIDEATSLADRRNMAYAGTVVISGQGTGLVVAIAEATETGRISQLVEQGTSLKTPLTRKLEKFSWRLSICHSRIGSFYLGSWFGTGKNLATDVSGCCCIGSQQHSRRITFFSYYHSGDRRFAHGSPSCHYS